MKKEQISIVIPVYNSAEIVERTLRSVRAQLLRPLNLILVDNNSTDSTSEVLHRWAEENSEPEFSVTVISENTPGASAARNRGLELVHTEWVMFFDADDLMSPEHVSTAMSLSNDADIICWDVWDLGNHKTLKFNTSDPLWNSLFHGTFATQRWMARTDLVRKAGGWNADVRLWDDIELGVRILNENPRIIKRRGEPMVTVLPTAGSMSSYSGGNYLERMEAPLKYIAVNNPKTTLWTYFVRAIHAGVSFRESSDDTVRNSCNQYMKHVYTAAPKQHRPMLRFTYTAAKLGMRGIARFLEPFIK